MSNSYLYCKANFEGCRVTNGGVELIVKNGGCRLRSEELLAIFKLQLGASISRSLGLSLCLSLTQKLEERKK